MAIGQLELALRVAAGLFVVVAPTLLFLGLWNGLMRLRDENLIAQVRRMEGQGSTSPAASGRSASPVVASGAGETVVCDACGTPNLEGMRYCQECLGSLSSE